MKPIVVAGITNLETAVRVENFPLEYAKSRFVFDGVSDRPGGVGYNVARALAHLGAPVELATLLGKDVVGDVLESTIRSTQGLGAKAVLRFHETNLRSAILVEQSGRAAMFTDLKNSQDIAFPMEAFLTLLTNASIVHASNINWAFALAEEARRAGVRVSTDVQAIRSLDEAYNARFLRVADVVLFSSENYEGDPKDAIRRLWSEFGTSLVVVTQAERGVLIGDRAEGTILHQPATPLRPQRNATGAGDAFAAGFLSGLQAGLKPWHAALRGQLVAGYRIGEEGSGHGLPPRELLDAEFERRR